MESGREIKERERSHRRRQAWRELKVEEEKEGPPRETAPVRLKCETQQGVLSPRSAWHLCVCVCFHVIRCWGLVGSGIYSWCVGLSPWHPNLIHNWLQFFFSNATLNLLQEYGIQFLSKRHTHDQWISIPEWCPAVLRSSLQLEGSQLGCGFQPLYVTINTEHSSRGKVLKCSTTHTHTYLHCPLIYPSTKHNHAWFSNPIYSSM